MLYILHMVSFPRFRFCYLLSRSVVFFWEFLELSMRNPRMQLLLKVPPRRVSSTSLREIGSYSSRLPIFKATGFFGRAHLVKGHKSVMFSVQFIIPYFLCEWPLDQVLLVHWGSLIINWLHAVHFVAGCHRRVVHFINMAHCIKFTTTSSPFIAHSCKHV